MNSETLSVLDRSIAYTRQCNCWPMISSEA